MKQCLWIPTAKTFVTSHFLNNMVQAVFPFKNSSNFIFIFEDLKFVSEGILTLGCPESQPWVWWPQLSSSPPLCLLHKLTGEGRSSLWDWWHCACPWLSMHQCELWNALHLLAFAVWCENAKSCTPLELLRNARRLQTFYWNKTKRNLERGSSKDLTLGWSFHMPGFCCFPCSIEGLHVNDCESPSQQNEEQNPAVDNVCLSCNTELTTVVEHEWVVSSW